MTRTVGPPLPSHLMTIPSSESERPYHQPAPPKAKERPAAVDSLHSSGNIEEKKDKVSGLSGWIIWLAVAVTSAVVVLAADVLWRK